MVINERVISMFSLFVHHITGVAVMVLVVSTFQGILIKPDSKISTGRNPTYLGMSKIDCEIDLGLND